jgi:hypothetical protein
VCVFYDVKPLCEREKRVFFSFFFLKKSAALKSARKWQSMGKGRSDFGATRRRTRACVCVNARRRVEFIKHHVINSNKQNVIKKSDIVQVLFPVSERARLDVLCAAYAYPTLLLAKTFILDVKARTKSKAPRATHFYSRRGSNLFPRLPRRARISKQSSFESSSPARR